MIIGKAAVWPLVWWAAIVPVLGIVAFFVVAAVVNQKFASGRVIGGSKAGCLLLFIPMWCMQPILKLGAQWEAHDQLESLKVARVDQVTVDSRPLKKFEPVVTALRKSRWCEEETIPRVGTPRRLHIKFNTGNTISYDIFAIRGDSGALVTRISENEKVVLHISAYCKELPTILADSGFKLQKR